MANQLADQSSQNNLGTPKNSWESIEQLLTMLEVEAAKQQSDLTELLKELELSQTEVNSLSSLLKKSELKLNTFEKTIKEAEVIARKQESLLHQCQKTKKFWKTVAVAISFATTTVLLIGVFF